MDTTVNENVSEKIITGRRNDPSTLVKAIMENIDQQINEINRKNETDIEQMEAAIRNDIVEFSESMHKKYEESVKYEGQKIRNLAVIEMKKMEMHYIETFIKSIIDDSAVLIRNDIRYSEFLFNCVLSGVENVSGMNATILLSPDDLVYSEDIINKIEPRNQEQNIEVRSDDRLKTGGALVIDDDAGVIYNSSVERIIYRMNDEIRREIVRYIKDFYENELITDG